MGKHAASSVGGWHTAGALQATGGASINVQLLRRNDLFIPNQTMELTHSGINDGGSGDVTRPITERFGSFNSRLFAIPEIIPVDGTITALGFYTSAILARVWAAVFTDITLAGNHYPGVPVNGTSVFHYNANGAIANTYRSGAVTVPVTRGQIVWLVSQQEVNTYSRSSRHFRAVRPVFGHVTNSPLTSSVNSPGNQCSCHGIVTPAAVTYDAALAAFPNTGIILTSGQLTLGAQTVDFTLNRPTVDFKLTF